MHRRAEDPGNTGDAFSLSLYERQMQLAERELAAFVAAVTELAGPEQARLAAEDWLEESNVLDSPPRATGRDWRAVTVAASARHADRLSKEQADRNDQRSIAHVARRPA